VPRATKRRRITPPDTGAKPRQLKRAPVVDRKPSASTSTGQSKGKGKEEALPPARIYVAKKLSEVVGIVFGEAMSVEAAAIFASEVESALFHAFKDAVNGKEIAGVRYK
jgi:hypothetical protein